MCCGECGELRGAIESGSVNCCCAFERSASPARDCRPRRNTGIPALCRWRHLLVSRRFEVPQVVNGVELVPRAVAVDNPPQALEAMKPPSFVVMSGLPGSGKTTLGRRAAEGLGLPMIDKDDILEELFALKGVATHEQRRLLSRDADRLFMERAAASSGAVLVSFWHVPGMPSDSGTPTAWLSALSSRLAHVCCVCPPELAARRFFERKRHAGHLDSARTFREILASIEALAVLNRLDLEPAIEVDTRGDVDVMDIARKIQATWGAS